MCNGVLLDYVTLVRVSASVRARVATARGTARMHSARLYYCDAFTEMLMRGLCCIYYYTILTVSGGAARWMVVMTAAAAATAALLVSPHFAQRGLSLLKFPAPL